LAHNMTAVPTYTTHIFFIMHWYWC